MDKIFKFLKNVYKAASAKKKIFGSLIIVTIVLLFFIIITELYQHPKNGVALLTAPFNLWLSYLLMAAAGLVGYANGRHERKNVITSVIASLIILAFLVFGTISIYRRLGYENADLLIITLYISYQLTRLITAGWPTKTENAQ